MSGAFGKKTITPDTRLRLPLPRLAETLFTAGGSPLYLLSDEELFRACGTRIAFTGRAGGVSSVPYDQLNLGSAVGDDAACVEENRRILLESVGAGIWRAS